MHESLDVELDKYYNAFIKSETVSFHSRYNAIFDGYWQVHCKHAYIYAKYYMKLCTAKYPQ